MKIGILTQPLTNNYGGLLQNYALQKVLSELGHEAITIHIAPRKFENSIVLLASYFKRSLLKLLGRDIKVKLWFSAKENKVISKYTEDFVNKNIKTTPLISKKIDKGILKRYFFNAYIVGSDQVWRPKYSPQLSTYFLDFLENDKSVKKIAYAASFGVSNWEYSKSKTKKYGKLVKLFDAVSVREDSAIDLCGNHFNINAIKVLDPTMLLSKETYISLVNKSIVKQKVGGLFSYILDKSREKELIVNLVAQKYNLSVFSVMPKINYLEVGVIQDRIYPPVEEWIRGFMNADFVVTDSFHGTVFSILFNKPFVSIVNNNRGSTRFISLLKLFQLEDRMVNSFGDFNMEKIKDIDWGNTNAILKREKEMSIQFLNEHLR